jgi:hypothetical protein
MHFLEKGSSAVIMGGPIIASSDGYSPSTALALTTGPAIKLSKNGAAYGNRGSTQAVASTVGGYYTIPLSSNDTDTLGRLRMSIYKNSTQLPAWEDFTVVESNVYDSLFGGSTYLKVDVQTIEGADATTQITQAVLNSTLEYSYTVKQGLRIMAAALSGRSTGAGSTTLKFQAMGSSDKNRIDAACGSSGNRHGMTLDPTT